MTLPSDVAQASGKGMKAALDQVKAMGGSGIESIRAFNQNASLGKKAGVAAQGVVSAAAFTHGIAGALDENNSLGQKTLHAGEAVLGAAGLANTASEVVLGGNLLEKKDVIINGAKTIAKCFTR